MYECVRVRIFVYCHTEVRRYLNNLGFLSIYLIYNSQSYLENNYGITFNGY